MRLGNTALAALVLLISSVVSIAKHQTARSLILGDKTARVGPAQLGDQYPIRISTIDDASQIKPEVEGTRWVYHLCHPDASFINVHFSEFGKLSLSTKSSMISIHK
jgi:hypothetical protein